MSEYLTVNQPLGSIKIEINKSGTKIGLLITFSKNNITELDKGEYNENNESKQSNL
jgi:hypothetical protein